MNRIVKIMKRLRSKEGCPWDRKQTLSSLKRCLLEETHEVCEAIDKGKARDIEEELGDVLVVIGLMIAIGEDQERFYKKDVISRVCKKMRDRHPHVFGNVKVKSAEEALAVFRSMKEKERGKKAQSLFSDLSKSLPGLIVAEKTQQRVARVGLDWKDKQAAVSAVASRLGRVKRVLASKAQKKKREEVGDLLLAAVHLSRIAGVHAEGALLEANARFQKRFKKIEVRHVAKKEAYKEQHGSRFWRDLWQK